MFVIHGPTMRCFAINLLCIALYSVFGAGFRVELPPYDEVQEELAELNWRGVLPNCGISRQVAEDQGDRIVGGRKAIHGELPWQISLQVKSWTGSFSHTCGGTILNRNYVITAAHCVSRGQPSNYRVVAGEHDIRKPNKHRKTHEVSSIQVHEDFTRVKVYNDIAILRLSAPLDIEGSDGYINGACLPESMTEPSGEVTVSGWGAIREGGSLPAVLQVVTVSVVSSSVCRQQYGSSVISDHMFCAGVDQGGKDSCEHDSGGPLVQREKGRAYLLGVVSWGEGCARPNWSGVYTKVSHYIDWIQRHTP